MAKKKTKSAATTTADAADWKDTKTSASIEGMAKMLMAQARLGRNPTLKIPIRALSNVEFDARKKIIRMGDRKQDRELFDAAAAKRFMQTVLVAAACRQVVGEGKTTSIRDVFYMVKHTIAGEGRKENTVDDQSESDECIEDLEVTLDALREELGLHAENKGSIIGPMTVTNGGDTINLATLGTSGWSVPSIVEPESLGFLRNEAKYVLLIEKGAVWNRFSQDKFWRDNQCVIIHGGGQPPRGVRRLVYRMHHELKLPVYVLADNDPWGYYIYSVVKQGSINLAYESSRMPIPEARFLGLSSFDRERYGLSDDVVISLEDTDRKRAKQVMEYDWFKDKPAWQTEIAQMLKSGVKLELEALSSRGTSFITQEYVPDKIRRKQWLD